jgi:methionine aminopeptidase
MNGHLIYIAWADVVLCEQVVERFTGHGIGTDMHMFPHVFHIPTGNRLAMQPGITFTIEPMVTAGALSLKFSNMFCVVASKHLPCTGSPDCFIWDDGWSVATADDSYVALFKHMHVISLCFLSFVNTISVSLLNLSTLSQSLTTGPK